MTTTLCDRCGRARRRGDRFCPQCGAPFQGVAERKHVSVLFADLCGSTARVDGVDPEEARADLDAALLLLTDAVQAFGGTVSQVLGDGVLAFFGAPLAQEDHALRACLAALAIHERAAAAPPPGSYVFRVGIDSGEVIVGSDGVFLAAHYRADGDTLHRARRLEELAAPGRTLVSGGTQRLVDGQVEFEARGDHALRGLDKPVAVFELCGGAQRSAVAPLARRHQLAPLMGREAALDALDAQVAAVQAGRLRFVGIRGEAGIGKSRLAAELAGRVERAGFASFWVRARAWTRRVPYRIISELAQALLGVPADGPAQAQRDAAKVAICAGGEALVRHGDALADLLDLGDCGDAWAALAPSLRRRRLADAVQALIEARLARGPLLVVIDDLFFADGESQRLLEHVVKRLEQAPVLICATYRQDFTHRWSDAAWFGEHWIGPLAAADMGRLARAIVGDDPSTAEVQALLVERAAGNPFFLEQMAMSLVDEGALVGPPGAYGSRRDVADLRAPASIAAVITSRVDRLADAAKAALECAALLGDPITADLVSRMLPDAPHGAGDALQQALAAGLLVAAGDAPVRYAFRHAMVQEVVAGALSRVRRRTLHRAAYDALRSDAGQSASQDPAVLAQHAYAGEAWLDAATCALQAMSRAIARSANRDALNFFAIGLDAAGRPGQDPAQVAPVLLALRMEALGAQMPLGKLEEAIDNLEQAHAITRALGDGRRESGVSLQLAVILWSLGAYERGLAAADAAEASARRCAGRSAQMAARQSRMMMWHGLGQYPRAVDEARRLQLEFAVELRTRRLLPRWAVMASVNAQVFAADALGAMGDFEAAQAACDAAHAELAAGEHVFSRILLDFVQGNVWIAQGRCRDAAAMLQGAREACRAHDVPTMEPPIVARLCVAMARTGQIGPALALIEHAIAERLERLGGRYNAYYFPASHAAVLFEAGRCEDALAAAATALAQARRYGQRGFEAEVSLLAGRVAARAGRPDLASQHFGHAAALAADCGMAHVQAQAERRLHPGARDMPLSWVGWQGEVDDE